MEGLTKGRWLFFVLACYMDIVLSVIAYKKPAFCQKEGEPFSFLWSIKRDPPSYLFGTIHVPYTRVWDHIPDNAKLAFSASSSVFFELDLLRPDTVSALATCQMLPGGASLRQVLPEDIYARLKRHLEYVRGMMPRWTTDNSKKQRKSSGGGMYYADSLFRALAGDWERKRPVWVMLMVNGLTEGEVRWRGVPVLDLFLAQEAERTGKGTAAVETVEEQCLPLNGLNISQVLFALNHTLLQHELREHDPQSSSYTADDLVHHYNCGDLDSSVFGQDSALPVLNASSSSSSPTLESSEEERSIDAYFRQELIYNRNKRMGSRVVELMEKNQGRSLFFAFGAGHFLGNNSVLDFIQDHGFEVDHLSVNAKIPKSKSKKSVSSDGLKPVPKQDSEAILNRKSQGRRSSRHRNPSAIPSLALRQRLFDTSTPVTATTQRAKSFNDLWVRLDVNEKKLKNGNINSIAEHRGPHQAFQKWHQESHRPNTIPMSAGANLLNSNPSFFIIAFICSYFSTLHIDIYVITLIGIT